MTIKTDEDKNDSEKFKYSNIFYKGTFIEDTLDIDEFLKKKIYRIESFDRVKELLQNEELVLVRPGKWDDPYENFFLKRDSVITNDGQSVSLQGFKKDWYGQCWTLKKESDAIWRIYSTKKDGIRITTTVEKLFDAIYDTDKFPKAAFLRFFIGEVEYKKLEDIQKIIENTRFQDIARGGNNKGFASLLMIKREEFSHEEEVRILAAKLPPLPPGDEDEKGINENIDECNGLWKFKVDIKELLLGNLYLDPRLDEDKFDEYRKILEKEKNKKNLRLKIEQSKLYKFEEEPIRL